MNNDKKAMVYIGADQVAICEQYRGKKTAMIKGVDKRDFLEAVKRLLWLGEITAEEMRGAVDSGEAMQKSISSSANKQMV